MLLVTPPREVTRVLFNLFSLLRLLLWRCVPRRCVLRWCVFPVIRFCSSRVYSFIIERLLFICDGSIFIVPHNLVRSKVWDRKFANYAWFLYQNPVTGIVSMVNSQRIFPYITFVNSSLLSLFD